MTAENTEATPQVAVRLETMVSYIGNLSAQLDHIRRSVDLLRDQLQNDVTELAAAADLQRTESDPALRGGPEHGDMEADVDPSA